MAKVIPITRALLSASISGILRLPFRPHVPEYLARSGRLLSALGESPLRALAIGCGYTEDDHRAGVHHRRWAARDVTYAEWLRLEVARPHRDPDDLETISALRLHVDSIGEKIDAAIREIASEDDRRDVTASIFTKRAGTEYARASSLVSNVRTMRLWGLAASDHVWSRLVEAGIEDDLAIAEVLLESLRLAVEIAPIDVERRTYILADVAVAEDRLRDWLERARGIFGSSLTRDELSHLGLGEAAPEAKPYSSAELTRFLDATRS